MILSDLCRPPRLYAKNPNTKASQTDQKKTPKTPHTPSKAPWENSVNDRQMLKHCCTDKLYKLITKSVRKRALRHNSVHNDYCKRKESHGTSQLAMQCCIKNNSNSLSGLSPRCRAIPAVSNGILIFSHSWRMVGLVFLPVDVPTGNSKGF